MQSIDLLLFHSVGAGFTPDPRLLQVALRTTLVATWTIVAVLAVAAGRRRDARVDVLLTLLCAGLVGMLAHALAAHFDSPRPFMLGLSPDYGRHSERGGFPSTHASVMFAVAVFMAWRPRLRLFAGVVALMAVATGLARVYLGIHFPLDVLGGLALGAVTGSMFAALRSLFDRWHRSSSRTTST